MEVDVYEARTLMVSAEVRASILFRGACANQTRPLCNPRGTEEHLDVTVVRAGIGSARISVVLARVGCSLVAVCWLGI